MYRTSKQTEDIPVAAGGELLTRARCSVRSLGGGYAGTVVPMFRPEGSRNGVYRNLPYTAADGSAVAAGTAFADDTEYELDTAGRDVILRHTVTTPGSGAEITTNTLMG